VIKTLALPKLIHLLTSLPNLKQSLFNDLDKLFFYFIWDGKPEKIKRNTLVADFEDGGLKMIHLQQFNAYMYLKISFQHDVKLSDEQKKTLWRGTYHSRNVVNLLN
jgi:hypothetical protein